MSWLPKTSKAFRVACGIVVSASAVAWVVKDRSSDDSDEIHVGDKTESGISSKLGLGKVLASWTTNFKPSVPWDANWDRRDPKTMVKPAKSEEDRDNFENKVKEATPRASRNLILIRHGQYNLDGEKDPQRYLTSLGKEQAEYSGKRLKELNFPYTVLIHSSMTRAIETANIIHQHISSVPSEQCDLLREGAPIPPEPPVGHWRPESSFYQDGARIEAAFRKYFHRAPVGQSEDSYEVIVCHANVIRYVVCRVLQIPPEAWLRMSLNHASLTWVTIRPNGRVCLRALGDSGHIPPDKLTVS